MMSTNSILIIVLLACLRCWCCIPGTFASPLLRDHRRQQSRNTVFEVILPLGDSITSNGFGYFSYRYYLWRLLVLFSENNNYFDFDFVGTLENNYNGNPEWPPVNGQTFDRDHEGHWGWRADQIINELAGWLDSYETVPTIALIHLGTNDCFQGQPASTTLEELEEIAEILWSYNPDMKLFYAKIIPSTRPVQDCLDAVNSGIESLQSKYNNSNSNIVLVDMANGFDPVTDTWDGTHPNNHASEIMAKKWFDAIMLQQHANNSISPSMAPTTIAPTPLPTQSSSQQDNHGCCCRFWRWMFNY